MAYNTGNPVGSEDPRDLIDNAGNLDQAVVGEGEWTDRLGNQRSTLKKIEADYPLASVFAAEAEGYRDQSATSATASSMSADRSESAANSAATEVVGIQESIDAITADPQNAVTAIWIPARFLEVTQGGALFKIASLRIGAWYLPDAVVSYLTATVQFPSHWTTMRCRFYFVNPTANAGNVVLTCEAHNWLIGESVNATPSGHSAIPTVPSTQWIAAEGVTTNAVTVDPSKTTTLRIGRSGQSTSDTLPSDVALIGVRLEKLT